MPCRRRKPLVDWRDPPGDPPIIALTLLVPALSQDHRSVFPDGESVTLVRGCDRSDDEITVCGQRDQSPHRLAPLPPRSADKPLRPEMALPGGASARAEAVQRSVGGVSAPAAMVTLRIPIGKGSRAREPK